MCVLVCLCYLQVLTAPWVSGAFALALILAFTIADALSGLAGGRWRRWRCSRGVKRCVGRWTCGGGRGEDTYGASKESLLSSRERRIIY
jgi:hypothetical protein